MLIYGNSPYDGPIIPYDRINANKSWLKHYENWLYLDFIARKGDRKEKDQARSELIICERKMTWNEKHPNFDWVVVIPEKLKLQRQWRK